MPISTQKMSRLRGIVYDEVQNAETPKAAPFHTGDYLCIKAPIHDSKDYDCLLPPL